MEKIRLRIKLFSYLYLLFTCIASCAIIVVTRYWLANYCVVQLQLMQMCGKLCTA